MSSASEHGAIMRFLGETTGLVILGAAILPMYFASKCYEERAEDIAKNTKIKAANAAEQKRVADSTEAAAQNRQKVATINAQYKKRLNFLSSQYNKVDDMLQEAYSVNLIPVQFRNLAAVWYIHSYMSTSQETLTTALFSQQINDGIRQILSRLDTIVQQNAENLFYQRRIEAQNSAMLSQNKRMLNSLSRIDTNTYNAAQSAQEAAQYAQIGASYSKASAYFSLANYLKD